MGRASREEKDHSRARIVSSAARLVRERGIDGASVGDVMKHAGMTHGGFYRHFATKDALLAAAIDQAFQEIVAPLETDIATRGAGDARAQFRAFYLSDGHLRNAGRGCPAAALVSEVARAPQSIRQGFANGVRAMLSALARTRLGDDDTRMADAARDLAMMVGALMIARASDPDTARLMLSACRIDRHDARDVLEARRKWVIAEIERERDSLRSIATLTSDRAKRGADVVRLVIGQLEVELAWVEELLAGPNQDEPVA